MPSKGPLRRHPSLIPLSRDHHHGLVLAQLLKYDVPDYRGMPQTVEGKIAYAIRFCEEELRPHFRKEEEILLPAVAGYDALLDAHCERIRSEHRQLAQIPDAWRASTPTGADLDEFGRLLAEHIRFEERVFFQRLQAVVPHTILDGLDLA